MPRGGSIGYWIFYLSLFDAGDSRADVDGGSGTGTPDGGVEINDLIE